MSSREQYRPGPAAGAQVHKDGERWTLILVRELRHPPSRVWQALTDPMQLREWAPFDSDRSLAWIPKPVISDTHVTRAEAAKLLEYRWGDNELRWQLEPLDNGTRLTLWHHLDRRFISMGAAGWHICFDVLDRFLAGEPLGRIVAGEAMKFDWPRLNAQYGQQFGLESPQTPAKR